MTEERTYLIEAPDKSIYHFKTKEELKAWIQGARYAIWLYAHWDEGIMYVGTTGRLFKDAIEELDKIYKKVTGEDYF